jgi:hypothetical protein
MLYDNFVDPQQLENLAELEERTELRARLASMAERLRECVGSVACRSAAP